MSSRHPDIADAPGLRWPSRRAGWVATWVARVDLVARGYTPRTQRLFPPSGQEWSEPGEADVKWIQSECRRLQRDMLAWAHEGGHCATTFTGTLKSLIDSYRTDPDSRFQKLRIESRRNYNSALDFIAAAKGAR